MFSMGATLSSVIPDRFTTDRIFHASAALVPAGRRFRVRVDSKRSVLPRGEGEEDRSLRTVPKMSRVCNFTLIPQFQR